MTFTFSTSDDVQSGRMYISALGRVVGSEDYRARWIIDPNGRVQAQVSRGGSVIGWRDLSGIEVEPGKEYQVRFQVDGVGESSLRSKVWAVGSEEPESWQLSASDSTPALQQAGYVGISTYAGGGISPTPYRVFIDDVTTSEVSP